MPTMPPPARATLRAALRAALRDLFGAALRRWRPRPRCYAFHYERVLGTSLELQVVATHRAAAGRAESAALAEIDRLERVLSGYASASELARWLASGGEPVPVSPELAEVLEAAEAWRRYTGGAFDPVAVSRVVAPPGPRWVVDRGRGVASGLTASGLTASRLTTLPVSLDALAKGYVVDRAAACARQVDGVTQVLVNVGGDLRHHGSRALTVGVTDPRAPSDNAPPLATVRIRDEALCTSGGYFRAVSSGGRATSHIVDPRTGAPAARVLGASVVAPDCMTADALSTAFSVLSPPESVALADALPGVGCLLVEADGTVTTSAEWRRRSESIA
ncbi:MAG: FAD:protein FMN transferase [Gemmatirosa sp.]|nr:FAD:protein FMN transferase [Gemmatirosa sp.]